MRENGTTIRRVALLGTLLIFGLATGYMFGSNEKPEPSAPGPRVARNPLEASIWAAENVEALGFPKEFDPSDQGERASFFVTNIDEQGHPKNHAAIFPINRYIYFFGDVLYSQEFADRYGYPRSHVAELDDGLHLIEFTMQTEGWLATCEFSFLIDKSYDLYLPTGRFQRLTRMGSSNLGSPIILPKRTAGFKERNEDNRFRLENRGAIPGGNEKDFYTTTYLSGQDYVPERGRPGSLTSVALEAFSPTLYKNLNYVVIRVTCSQLAWAAIESENSQFWFRSRESKEIGVIKNQDSADYFRFRVPARMKRRIIPMMKSRIQNTEGDRRKILERYYESISSPSR